MIATRFRVMNVREGMGQMVWTTALRRVSAAVVAAVMLLVATVAVSVTVSDTATAQQAGQVPGQTSGATSDPSFWRAIRQGTGGTVSIPDKQAGVLIQSEGDGWRAFRLGPLSTYGVWGLAGIAILLAIFFLIRGRIRIEAGPSTEKITRFDGYERFGHWLLAVSFIILALSGLNLLYGRYFLIPVIGPDAFASITILGKLLHNYVAFAFMAGLLLIFMFWIKDNFPSRHDVMWVLKAGGMFSKHSHPPAKRFNAGQKLIFWLVILGGVSLSLSGIALMFPFQFALFADTFVFLNKFGLNLPTELTPMQEMQLSQLWHSAVALGLTVVIVAHIYIGSVGMEGAFDAMGSGEVDKNWAREHHSLWVQKVDAQAGTGQSAQVPPAVEQAAATNADVEAKEPTGASKQPAE